MEVYGVFLMFLFSLFISLFHFCLIVCKKVPL